MEQTCPAAAAAAATAAAAVVVVVAAAAAVMVVEHGCFGPAIVAASEGWSEIAIWICDCGNLPTLAGSGSGKRTCPGLVVLAAKRSARAIETCDGSSHLASLEGSGSERAIWTCDGRGFHLAALAESGSERAI